MREHRRVTAMAKYNIKSAGRRWTWVWRGAALALAGLAVLPYAIVRPPAFPEGFDVRAGPYPLPPGGARVLIDGTAFDERAGKRVVRQEIFDDVLGMIGAAKSFVVLDFFLWNDWQGRTPERHRELCRQLAEALIAKRRSEPDVAILALTDPINRQYGARVAEWHRALADAGVPVVYTDLDRLPDSNALYARPARFYGPTLCRLPGLRGLLGHPRWVSPFQPGTDRLAIREWGRLLLFKANHRKVLFADGPDGRIRGLVTSLNPADGSSAHSNAALRLEGDAARAGLEQELAVALWSSARPGGVVGAGPAEVAAAVERVRARHPYAGAPPAFDGPRCTWLTEGAIRQALLEVLDDAGRGDQVRVALFYLSERRLIRGLCGAAAAGADVRVILDPNRDAFGRVKNGIPNRPVAHELTEFARRTGSRVTVRWADTHGEQFHTKAVSVSNAASGKSVFCCGSANWTRRNVANLNLEANALIEGAPEVAATFDAYFDRVWTNADGLSSTVPYEAFAETGWTLRRKAWMGAVQELTGLCSF